MTGPRIVEGVAYVPCGPDDAADRLPFLAIEDFLPTDEGVTA